MITLIKAAELVDFLVIHPEKPLDEDMKDALSLASQALRRIAAHRIAGHFFAQQLLPTEIAGRPRAQSEADALFDAIPSHTRL